MKTTITGTLAELKELIDCGQTAELHIRGTNIIFHVHRDVSREEETIGNLYVWSLRYIDVFPRPKDAKDANYSQWEELIKLNPEDFVNSSEWRIL